MDKKTMGARKKKRDKNSIKNRSIANLSNQGSSSWADLLEMYPYLSEAVDCVIFIASFFLGEMILAAGIGMAVLSCIVIGIQAWQAMQFPQNMSLKDKWMIGLMLLWNSMTVAQIGWMMWFGFRSLTPLSGLWGIYTHAKKVIQCFKHKQWAKGVGHILVVLAYVTVAVMAVCTWASIFSSGIWPAVCVLPLAVSQLVLFTNRAGQWVIKKMNQHQKERRVALKIKEVAEQRNHGLVMELTRMADLGIEETAIKVGETTKNILQELSSVSNRAIQRPNITLKRDLKNKSNLKYNHKKSFAIRVNVRRETGQGQIRPPIKNNRSRHL